MFDFGTGSLCDTPLWGNLVDPTKHLPSHPNEEVLEEYVRRHLPEVLIVQVEEHLLLCESCQATVQKIDVFVSAMKASGVARGGPAGDPVRSSGPVIAHRTAQGWSPGRKGLASVLALTVLALLVLRKHPDELSGPVAVTLSSVRGPEVLAVAPAGKQLELRIDAPDLTPGQAYGFQVVDAAGRQVWRGTVTYTDGMRLAQIPDPLKPGVYWIRLYDAADTALREFGMSVK